MINKLPILGWVFSAIAAASLAVPFWCFYSAGGLGERYFYWLPEVYRDIPFWHCVGLFIVIAILKGTLIPTIASQTNEQNVGKK